MVINDKKGKKVENPNLLDPQDLNQSIKKPKPQVNLNTKLDEDVNGVPEKPRKIDTNNLSNFPDQSKCEPKISNESFTLVHDSNKKSLSSHKPTTLINKMFEKYHIQQPPYVIDKALAKINKSPPPHGIKRKRTLDEDIENHRQNKILKAMLAIIDLMDETDDSSENAFLSEILVSAALICKDIPIPRSYKTSHK